MRAVVVFGFPGSASPCAVQASAPWSGRSLSAPRSCRLSSLWFLPTSVGMPAPPAPQHHRGQLLPLSLISPSPLEEGLCLCSLLLTLSSVPLPFHACEAPEGSLCPRGSFDLPSAFPSRLYSVFHLQRQLEFSGEAHANLWSFPCWQSAQT